MTDRLEIAGSVAVVTGGASGIGRALARELRDRQATVVIADVEAAALETTAAELGVDAMVVDVTDETSTAALADHVWSAHGGCDLLFLNAGVTSGGGGLPWQQEPNDWRWCLGVNVVGLGIGVSTFVPRMLADGRAGQIVVTSSKDGGIAPVRTASVYAASKAAATCFTEALDANLVAEGTALRASVFYPSGGLLDTGLYTAARNRPAELARVGEATGRSGMSFDELKARVAAATGREPAVADLGELAAFACDEVARRAPIIGRDLDAAAAILHRRADAVAAGDAPPLLGLLG